VFDKSEIIPIGSDHGGFRLKKSLIEKLVSDGYKIHDFGTNSEESVDYPDFIHPVAKGVDSKQFNTGIIICGSGQGANMVANKYPGVRSALCWNEQQAELCRQHNNANVISIPGRFVNFDTALKMVMLFLNTEFEGGRHQKRIEKIPIKY